MHPSPEFDHPPAAVQTLRDAARTSILWLLWLAPAVLGGLAARGGMGWELVTLMGIGVAIAATAGSRRRGRGRLMLGLGLAVAAGLLLGAGRGSLPEAVMIALPFLALALVGALGDGRALLVALAVLMLACLLPLGVSRYPALPPVQLPPVQAGGLALEAVLLLVGMRLWRRAARQRERVTVLPGGTAASTRVFSQPAPSPVPPAFLVQAERAPDGTLRVALAGRDAGRLRVTVT